jgi:hypothetical protein
MASANVAEGFAVTTVAAAAVAVTGIAALRKHRMDEIAAAESAAPAPPANEPSDA